MVQPHEYLKFWISVVTCQETKTWKMIRSITWKINTNDNPHSETHEQWLTLKSRNLGCSVTSGTAFIKENRIQASSRYTQWFLVRKCNIHLSVKVRRLKNKYRVVEYWKDVTFFLCASMFIHFIHLYFPIYISLWCNLANYYWPMSPRHSGTLYVVQKPHSLMWRSGLKAKRTSNTVRLCMT